MGAWTSSLPIHGEMPPSSLCVKLATLKFAATCEATETSNLLDQFTDELDMEASGCHRHSSTTDKRRTVSGHSGGQLTGSPFTMREEAFLGFLRLVGVAQDDVFQVSLLGTSVWVTVVRLATYSTIGMRQGPVACASKPWNVFTVPWMDIPLPMLT